MAMSMMQIEIQKMNLAIVEQLKLEGEVSIGIFGYHHVPHIVPYLSEHHIKVAVI